MFLLWYDAKTKKVSALNGSGRAPGKATLDKLRKDVGIPDSSPGGKIPIDSVHSVTVPGAAAGWCDTVERFGSGKLSLEQVLAPAIELGEKGFPISELSAGFVSGVTTICHTYTNISAVGCWRTCAPRSVAKLQGDAEARSFSTRGVPITESWRTLYQQEPRKHLPYARQGGQEGFLLRPNRRVHRQSMQGPWWIHGVGGLGEPHEARK